MRWIGAGEWTPTEGLSSALCSSPGRRRDAGKWALGENKSNQTIFMFAKSVSLRLEQVGCTRTVFKEKDKKEIQQNE